MIIVQYLSNFSEYMTKVNAYLSVNKFEVKRNIALSTQHIDIFGIKELIKEGWPIILLSFSIQEKENVDVTYLDQFIKENLLFSTTALKSQIALPVIVTFPVIASSALSSEVIQKVVNYKPPPMDRWGFNRAFNPRLSHPVLINIRSREVYHNDKSVIGIQVYRKFFNQCVSETLSF